MNTNASAQILDFPQKWRPITQKEVDKARIIDMRVKGQITEIEMYKWLQEGGHL